VSAKICPTASESPQDSFAAIASFEKMEVVNATHAMVMLFLCRGVDEALVEASLPILYLSLCH
jgi:hypothetical protein